MKVLPSLLTTLCLLACYPGYAAEQAVFGQSAAGESRNINEELKISAGKLPFSLELPDLGAGASLLEQQQETRLGEMVLRQVNKELPLFEDAWTQDELNKVFNRIYSTAALGEPMGLVVVNDNAINAFAVPGGLFALNTGLILSVKNIDELAGVVGHEVAHVSQRHYSRSREAFKHQGLLTLGGMLASILLASQSSDAAGAVALGTQAALIDRQLSYSRNQEREADRAGMRLMYAAGYNPMAMADFFETMQRKTGSISFLPDFWLTHPLSTERMSEARLRAAQFPKAGFTLNLNQEQNLRLMQYRIAVLTEQITEAQLTSAATDSPAARLALASFYAKQGKFAQARKLAAQVAEQLPDLSLVTIVQAEIELNNNYPGQALALLLPRYRIMPENRVLAIYTARAYSAAGQGQQAMDILQPLSLKRPRDVLLWQGLETAANRLPDGELKTLQVLYFRAENLFWRGEVDGAIRTLIRAKTLAGNNHSMLARIESRLDKMQEARRFRP